MAEDNGFLGYHVPKGHKYHGRTNDIVPGEAALLITSPTTSTTTADRGPRQVPGLLHAPVQGASTRSDSAPWPYYIYDNDMRLALVQMGPWTVMAANAYHERTGNKRSPVGLEVMMDDRHLPVASRSTPWPDYTGGYFKMAEEPAMQAFCYAEDGRSLPARDSFDPEQSPFFEKSTREAMPRLACSTPGRHLRLAPLPSHGRDRYALNETKVRIDYVHHGLSSMYQYVKGAKMDPQVPESVRGDYPAPK